MKQNIFLSLFSVAVLFICTSFCVQAQSREGTVKPQKFERLMNKPNTVIIDVRTPEEYNGGHIPGAINMDVNGGNFLHQIKSLDSTKKYLLYCRSGKRSESALNIMRARGFPRVVHLKGGIEAWHGPKE